MRDRSTIKPKLSHGARGSLGSLSHTQLTGGSQYQRALEGSAMDRSAVDTPALPSSVIACAACVAEKAVPRHVKRILHGAAAGPPTWDEGLR